MKGKNKPIQPRQATPLTKAAPQAVPPGYKRTEVGVIPEDWGVERLGDFCETYSGGTPSTSHPEYYGGRIPWITSSDLNAGRIRDVPGRITDLGLARSAAKMTNPGTVLVALYGATAGVVAITEIVAAINQAVLAVVPKSADNEYLFQYLLHRKRDIVETYTQGGQPNLSGEIVRSLAVAIPPPDEQRAIAGVLSDVDGLIKALDKLIAKKRAIKQAAMQQLLTGKTRLPGFHGEWETKKLGEIADLYQPETIAAHQFKPYGYPVYGANGLVGYYHRYNHETWQVIVTCRGSTCGTVNKTVDRCWITGNAMVISCDKKESIDKEFLYYLLLHSDLSICITGTVQPQIVRTPLSNYELFVPSDNKEQRAIAEVLSDMDAEIDALERRREKVKQIKQGMMQQLLTGRIRLVKPKTAGTSSAAEAGDAG